MTRESCFPPGFFGVPGRIHPSPPHPSSSVSRLRIGIAKGMCGVARSETRPDSQRLRKFLQPPAARVCIICKIERSEKELLQAALRDRAGARANLPSGLFHGVFHRQKKFRCIYCINCINSGSAWSLVIYDIARFCIISLRPSRLCVTQIFPRSSKHAVNCSTAAFHSAKKFRRFIA
jgi:hypothetical protein